MAKIVVKNNALKKKYAKYRLITVLGFGISALSILFLGLCIIKFKMIFAPLFIITFLGGAIVGYIMHGKAEAVKSGVSGEASIQKIISRLPNNYFGYKNLRISFKGRESELDMVVVGPTGVFIVETKNMRGYIHGNYDSRHWVQQKIGRGGTPYSKKFYSPIKQVGTHTYCLANFLRANGIRTHISPTVYFSNCEATVEINAGGEIPIFAAGDIGDSKLIKYIKKQDAVLSASDIRKITAFLEEI